MSGQRKPEAGEWWQKEGVRLLVVGTKRSGITVGEHECGSIDLFHHQHDWKHLPDCTGWDWQPETFPQYYINVKAGFCDAVYVVRDSKTTYYGVQENGERHPATLRWDAVNDRLVVSLDWKQVTQAEAEARVKKPEPVESPDDWVTQDRVPDRPGVDEWMRTWNDRSTGWEKSHKNEERYMHGHVCTETGSVFKVRCRRRDLPPLPQETPKREYVYLWSSWGNGRVYMTDISGCFDPKDRELKHDGTGFYLEGAK